MAERGAAVRGAAAVRLADRAAGRLAVRAAGRLAVRAAGRAAGRVALRGVVARVAVRVAGAAVGRWFCTPVRDCPCASAITGVNAHKHKPIRPTNINCMNPPIPIEQ